MLKRDNRCFVCTRTGYLSKDCRSRRTCFNCSGHHHTSICHAETKKEKNLENDKKNDDSNENVTQTGTTLSPKGNILMQTIRVNVHANKGKNSIKNQVECKIVLDSGSQRSFILKRIAKLIEASSHHTEELAISGFGGDGVREKEHDVVQVVLSNERNVVPIEAVVVENICRLNQRSDYYWGIITGDVVKGDSGATAMSSKFGYVLSGSAEGEKGSSRALMTNVLRTNTVVKEDVDYRLKTFWELESIGINEKEKSVEKFNINIQKEINRYVNLPWKNEEEFVLGDNFS